MSTEFEDYQDLINTDYTGKFDAQSNIMSDISGGATAAVVDFGASVFNSLVPERYETSTADLLSRISDNAFRVYNESPDAVHTASFIGGIFAPSGLALKGMNALRAGSKGVSWFSTEQRAADMVKLEELMRAGPEATSAYKALRNEVFIKGAANQVLDAAAMELAVVGTMSAHPFMEDYVKDPIKNFGISVALGGAVGSGIGHIADRFAVKAIEGAAESSAFQQVLSKVLPVPEGMPSATMLQIRQANINNLTAMVEQAGQAGADGETAMTGLAKHYANQVIEAEKVAQETEFQDMAKRLLSTTPKEHHEELKTLIMEKFEGIDAVSNLRMSEKTLSGGAKEVKLETDFGPPTKTIKKKLEDGTEVDVDASVSRVYFGEANGWGTVQDVQRIGRAQALKGVTEESLGAAKAFDKTAIQVPNNEASFEVFKKISPAVDKDYLEALIYVDKMDIKQLAKAAISPTDLPMLNAMVARIVKEKELGNVDFQALKVRLTKAEPTYDEKITQQIFKYNGVKPDHHIKMAEFTNPQAIKKYDLFRATDLSPQAKELLRGWRAGDGVAAMRSSADAYHFGGYGRNVPGAEAYGQLYNSSASRQLRSHFRDLADADGNVYLWRGMTKDPTGHAALQSYTTDIEKAREFGQPRLFKVSVDDITGAIADLKSKDGFEKNEIIVRAPKREVEPKLPVGIYGDMQPASRAAAKITSTSEASLQDVVSAAITAKEDLIRSMAAQGMDHLEIAIRTNTPKDAVQAWIGNGMKSNELATLGLNIWEYGAASELSKYLSPMKAPILAKTNVRKAPWAQMQANMDSIALNRASHQITQDFFAQGAATNPMVREFHDVMYGAGMGNVWDIMRAQLTQASNGNAGVRFINSADQYARKMKDFGVAATHVGKEIEGISNRIIERMIKPVQNLFGQITRDVVLQTEFNTAIKFNAQLKNFRVYKERQFWQKKEIMGPEGTPIVELVPALFQGREFKVASDAVDELLTHLQGIGREVYGAKGTTNKILGRSALHDIGFWVPALNPRDKHIAYVWNKLDDTTQILWGNTADELNAAISAYKPTVARELLDGSIEIVPKARQEGLNILKGRDDPLNMTIANVESFHSGASSPLIVKSNADVVAEIIGGLEHTVQNHVRQMAEISMYDISDNLQRMSRINTELSKNQPLGKLMQAINKPKDAAHEMRNILLGLKDLPDYGAWQDVNAGFEGVMGWGLAKATEIWKEVSKPAKGFLKKKGPSEIDYQTLSEKLDAAGVVNPYEVFGAQASKIWEVAGLQGNKNQTARMIYASNAFAATAALRFGELAQPLVNAMSFPILASAAIAAKQPESFMGVKMRAGTKIDLAGAMHDGIRAMHSKHFEHLGDEWAKRGYFDPVVSEASKVLKLPREFQPGVIAATERALESKLVTAMSKGADYSEALVRKTAMYTGAMLAKKLYPELGDAGITIYARNFMDRTIGNYHAAQRPVFFQGTLGTAMGLFQTYMLTFAQTMYRQLELKDYKALGKMMLAQSTIFGAGSLPGFHQVSELIGEHYSDDHTDLQTGLMRAVPDPVAKAVLYGLPSSFGPAFYTRGELAPRVTTPASLKDLPTVNMLGQVLSSVGSVVSAAASDGEDVPRAIGQALSLQSVSRPLARISELATGYSVTKQGNTVMPLDEVWTTTGVLSRLIATRPTEEAMLREANHLSTLYGSLDREERKKVVSHLKTAIREDSLEPDKLERWALDYMDNGGTPTGWRSAVRTAIAQTNVSMSGPMREKLKDTSSLNHMLDMLDE